MKDVLDAHHRNQAEVFDGGTIVASAIMAQQSNFDDAIARLDQRIDKQRRGDRSKNQEDFRALADRIRDSLERTSRETSASFSDRVESSNRRIFESSVAATEQLAHRVSELQKTIDQHLAATRQLAEDQSAFTEAVRVLFLDSGVEGALDVRDRKAQSGFVRSTSERPEKDSPAD